MEKKIKFNKRFFLPFIVLLIYSLTTVFFYSIENAITIIMTSFMIFIFLSSIINEKKFILNFANFYIFATLIAGLYGFFSKSEIIGVYYIYGIRTTFPRNIGTFTDPNYYGFFINIAIFMFYSVYGIKGEKKQFKSILILLAMYIFLFSTLSLTAMVANIILTLIFFISIKGTFIKKASWLIVATMMLILFIYIGFKFDVDIIKNTIIRAKNIFQTSNDISTITTSRSDIWINHLNIFKNQSIYKILFGGNYITDYGRNAKFTQVSHNAFIDSILNFGLIGTIIMFYVFSRNAIHLYKNYFANDERSYLGLFMSKCVWFIYAFALSMFPAWIFQLFFFL